MDNKSLVPAELIAEWRKQHAALERDIKEMSEAIEEKKKLRDRLVAMVENGAHFVA